jgi:hypothetical protein
MSPEGAFLNAYIMAAETSSSQATDHYEALVCSICDEYPTGAM